MRVLSCPPIQVRTGRFILYMALVLCLSPRGYGSQQEGRQADSAHTLGQIEHAKVSVEVERFAADETRAIFDVDLLRHDIQPLSLLIDNRSPQAYVFQKANVDDHYLPAAEVAKVAYENLVVGGTHKLFWAGLLPLKAIRVLTTSPARAAKHC